ncbi:DUF4412 domain-containing protein [Formosa algae]|uniref:DUF4412 domain-containing protein n=1 Tax=Formosa algae TaxID=225843 RepID=A0A9X0YIX6_9FLAO|nr:DUF4412 domain-containing protein [Formosa algae]MBP1839940.1 hypothetical protein [Formosa algae]MDQ0335539.1 hypothetical protein [Formosa algae]OEI81760.1 hypothetical protein AST99_02430 [Formosa algae]PNW26269.1 hypothetical protein BKP44_17610 [Formosa algae]
MKLKHIALIVALVFSGTQMHGQFLKKLKNKLQEVTEDIVIDKTSQKVEQSLGKRLDSLFGIDGDYKFGGINMGGFSLLNDSILPETYYFEWKYILRIESPEDDPIDIAYYLKAEEKYFGMQPTLDDLKKNDDVFIVMDTEHNTNAIFMTNNNKKTGMVMKMNLDLENIESDPYLENDFTFEELDDKVINGKNCKGFKMENDDAIMIMYNAMDAPVSFSSIFGINTKNVPKGFNPKWLNQAENSLIMEATYTDKSNNKSTTMQCIDLAAHDLQIHKQDYDFTSLGNYSN